MTTASPSTARDQRTYYVSDERLRAFGQLSYAQRMQWVEQCSQFVRMAQLAKAKIGNPAQQDAQSKPASN